MAIKQGKDYESVQIGGGATLPAGGYICQILKAEERNNKNGKPMVVLALDICEGDFAGFFQTKWKNKKLGADKPSEVKYPNDGMWYVNVENTDGTTNRSFKGLCTALEDSGVEVWNAKKEFLMDNLQNAKVGVIFRREENEWNGNTYWQTKAFGARSITTIESGDFTVPEDKPIAQNNNYNFPQDISGVDSFSAAEDDIPF